LKKLDAQLVLSDGVRQVLFVADRFHPFHRNSVQCFYDAGLLMIAWGTLNSSLPVAWSTWLAKGIRDEPESGGGLMVAAIQLAIMLWAAFGGLLLDHVSIYATFIGGAALLICSVATIGTGSRVRPNESGVG
jgi:predicted MFS family arabinose efflux permease